MYTKQLAYKKYHQAHYLLKCPYCGTELVAGSEELSDKYRPFKPSKEEFEYCIDKSGELKKRVGIQIVSSDYTKDIYDGLKCCRCGHIWSEKVIDVTSKPCNPDGSTNIRFELDEIESERAKAFVKEHDHRAEFIAQNKLGFSTLGQQFTYEITPGGFGNGVTIRCNKCKKRKNITNTENW